MGIPAWRGPGKQRTFLVGLFLVLFFSPSLSAQDDPELSFLPNPVGLNDRFTLSFEVDVPSASMVSIEEWDYPVGIRLYAGPNIRGIVKSREDGTSYPAVSVSYILLSNRTGRILFPRIPFAVGSESRRTGVGIQRVGSYRNSVLSLPLELEWEIPEGPFYEGQTIPAVLVMRNKEEILLPERVSVPASGGGLFEEAPELGEIRRRLYGDTVLYTVPVTGYLFTPTGAGRFFLNKASVTAEGISGTSDAVAVNVEALPGDVAVSGGVGRFDIDVSPLPEGSRVGETVQLTVRITGEGNLAYLTPPEPDFAGLVLVRSEETHDYRASQRGYQGSRETRYLLKAEEEGDYELHIPAFPFFDPRDNRVVSLPERRLTLQVLSGGEISIQEETFSLSDLRYTPDEILAAQSTELFRLRYIYLAFVPGPMLLLLFRVRRRRILQYLVLLLAPLALFMLSASGELMDFDQVRGAEDLLMRRDYQAASVVYREMASEHPRNGRLLFNWALCLEGTGKRAEAVNTVIASARCAVPDQRVRSFWDSLTDSDQYIRQYQLPAYFPPAVSFILLLIFYNLFFLAAVLAMFFKRSYLLLVSLLFGTLSFAAAGLFGHAAYVRSTPVAVVASDVVSRRIPRDSAEAWLELPEGLTVKVTQQSGDFLLLSTAYGVEGWVGSGDILRSDDLFQDNKERE
ncbi:BatD family protein [Marispirochaeta aestuarii]|uniref:BatD family protein n=1 Tax=Marispirochaeta aestuarii TaxID=1963862 RepID=UPI0029C8B908|nr:BatD family protein [Marispirochaeta aestuarii]